MGRAAYNYERQLATPPPTPPTNPSEQPPCIDCIARPPSPLSHTSQQHLSRSKNEYTPIPSGQRLYHFHPDHTEPKYGAILRSCDGVCFRVDLATTAEDRGFFYDLSQISGLFANESDRLLPLPSTGSQSLLLIVEWLKQTPESRLSLPASLTSATDILDDLIRAADMFTIPGIYKSIYHQLQGDDNAYPPIRFLFAVLSNQVHLEPPPKLTPPDGSSPPAMEEYHLKQSQQQEYWNALEEVTLELLPFSEDLVERSWWAETLRQLAPRTYRHLSTSLNKWDVIASSFGSYQHSQSTIFGYECHRGSSSPQSWPNGCRFYREYGGDFKSFREQMDPSLFTLLSSKCVTFGLEDQEKFEEAVRSLNLCSGCSSCTSRLARDLRCAVREAGLTFQSLNEPRSWRRELMEYRRRLL